MKRHKVFRSVSFQKEISKYDKNIQERVNKIVMFTADDEEEDGKKSLKIYNKYLDGKVIELKKHGHYTLEDMRTEEFPELLEEITN